MTATTAASGRPAPLVSVVLPTCDRVDLPGRCVKVLLDLASALTPLLAVFPRLAGATPFRVRFA